MGFSALQVQMLGTFSLRCGDQEINDGDNRSKKVWLLLAYMIYCRNRNVSQDELVNLLWGEEDSSTNPLNALKTMFHRVRAMLNKLDTSAGHMLIIRKEGSYAWNPAVNFTFDVDEFENLCKEASADQNEDTRLEKDLKAVALYKGDFLPKLSSEPWVVPINAYFHNLYVRTVQDAICLLESRSRLNDAIALNRQAITIEPYDETLYHHLMRELLDTGNQQGTVDVYQNVSELLFSNFGIMPSDEIQALYREAVRTINNREVSLGTVRDQLKEADTNNGALFCDYDFFRVIYHAEARAVARSGDAVHICLLTVSGAEKELSRRSLDICMDNLQELICESLRKGDIASRCSVSQYIIMLPQANYENSCKVCDRIVKSFCRQYPHSPAELRYSVQPLEPNT